MAIFIGIRKTSEDSAAAEYQFERTTYPDEELITGLLRIDKSTGAVTLVRPMPCDDDERSFSRASRKVWLHWQAGEFPEVTCWAA